MSEEADRKEHSLNELLEKIGLKDENANDVIENCYDIILNLVRAKLLLDGYKVSGYAAHEAEISYMKTLNFSDVDVNFMDRLRYFRNGIKYYGKRFDKEYATLVVEFAKRTCSKLKGLL